MKETNRISRVRCYAFLNERVLRYNYYYCISCYTPTAVMATGCCLLLLQRVQHTKSRLQT